MGALLLVPPQLPPGAGRITPQHVCPIMLQSHRQSADLSPLHLGHFCYWLCTNSCRARAQAAEAQLPTLCVYLPFQLIKPCTQCVWGGCLQSQSHFTEQQPEHGEAAPLPAARLAPQQAQHCRHRASVSPLPFGYLSPRPCRSAPRGRRLGERGFISAVCTSCGPAQWLPQFGVPEAPFPRCQASPTAPLALLQPHLWPDPDPGGLSKSPSPNHSRRPVVLGGCLRAPPCQHRAAGRCLRQPGREKGAAGGAGGGHGRDTKAGGCSGAGRCAGLPAPGSSSAAAAAAAVPGMLRPGAHREPRGAHRSARHPAGTRGGRTPRLGEREKGGQGRKGTAPGVASRAAPRRPGASNGAQSLAEGVPRTGRGYPGRSRCRGAQHSAGHRLEPSGAPLGARVPGAGRAAHGLGG